MGYSPWDHKELDTTEQLTLSPVIGSQSVSSVAQSCLTLCSPMNRTGGAESKYRYSSLI